MESIVFTGGTSGFGVNWLYRLDSEKNAIFYVLGRDQAKFSNLVSFRPFKNTVHFIQCELDSFASIQKAVEEIKTKTNRVDCLINNAGVWSNDDKPTSQDDIELTLAVNQLAPFILTGKLLPLLKNSSCANIINTASFRHKDARVDLDDIQLMANFNAEQAYCNSKLYSILFTKQLASLLNNTQVSVNCFDPGIVDTPMLSQAFPSSLNFIFPMFRRLVARTPDKGAETGIFLSTKTHTTGGYFKDCKLKKPSKQAMSSSLSDWLWTESEKLTGFKYACV
ncbi:short-chain dehydrogenase [Thalassotalea insulae]|uniref:Short-chain dehydrogenase n=1 Tax=Thalassotalea insulae TaxID=2056778 RepID=A0ABQ6GVE1_9GAMM|nr:SDR family NAD(P)-dependent oxidoreductase [Thalassotalea insulae]GLX79873.1 short-chain dehydrogenase [Thalassotalea insulae]